MKNGVKAWWEELIESGVQASFSTYEQGLIRLSNKAALLIMLIINTILLPAAIYGKLSAPILVINSIFVPFTLLLNHAHRYTIARHFLIGLLYTMMLLTSLYRGLESGILFLAVPSVLLTFIFFPKRISLYVHLSLLACMLVFVLSFSNNFAPLSPYPDGSLLYIYPIHLTIGIALSLAFITFFLKVNREYQRELLELNQTKNKLLSIIGHDVRGPLNSLRGVLQLLNNRQLSQEEFYTLSDHLQKNTESLYSTLDTLLHWSLSQMQGFEAKPKLAELDVLVHNLLDLIAETAHQKNINITSDIAPGTMAYYDPNLIQVAMRNLLGNALKFTPPGGSIHLSAEPMEAKGIRIAVSDTGIGIPEETLAKLFSNGLSKSRKGTRGEGGTGLGLLLSKEMIEINGGELWVSSEVGKGSTFYFTLPLPEQISVAAA